MVFNPLSLPEPSPTYEPFALLLKLLFFHPHPLLVYSLAGDVNVVLVREAVAVKGFEQVLDQHLRDSHARLLLL